MKVLVLKKNPLWWVKAGYAAPVAPRALRETN